jgi:hypothetical protein
MTFYLGPASILVDGRYLSRGSFVAAESADNCVLRVVLVVTVPETSAGHRVHDMGGSSSRNFYERE